MGVLILCGLGNPGVSYARNRHNVGFVVVDDLCSCFGVRSVRLGSCSVAEAALARGTDGSKVILAKPLRYMNSSGQPIAGLLRRYRAGAETLVVVHDDLELPFGTVRAKWGGGAGGHNGLRSIIACVGPDFLRIRVGIGRPCAQQRVADYVLSDFLNEESRHLPDIFRAIRSAVLLLDGEDCVSVVPRMNALFLGNRGDGA